MELLPDLCETVNIVFHEVEYQLLISTVNGDTLTVEVEQLSDASRWRGDFTARYIEDITSKTGNFKKFPVFVKMLLSAVKQASDSVFVDLLTYQDLEVLKSRKTAQQPAAARTIPPNNKRYLILTYAAEFDRVHYPLPLVYEEHPDPEHLKHIISRLRQEVETLRMESSSGSRGRGGLAVASGGGHESHELRRMREENSALRQQLKQLERVAVKSDAPDSERMTAEAREMARELKLVRKERDLLQSRVEHVEAELERDRGLNRRELRRKAKELQETQDDLFKAHELIRELKSRVKTLESQLEAAGRRGGGSSMDRVRSAYMAPTGRTGSSRGASTSYGMPSYGMAAPVRSNSRERDTSSRERSRPNSAPARPRFDPTEYIKQRKERERALSNSKRGGPTPPRSANTSGRSSPAASRPSSAERSRGISPASSRPSSAERPRPRPTYNDKRLVPTGARAGGTDLPKSRSSSPGTAAGARRPAPANAWGDDSSSTRSGVGGWSKFPAAGAAGSSVERSTSPGRALQEVKRKLSEYVQGARHDDGGSQADKLSQQSSKSQVFDDASAEIADIDSRLHALQNFLRQAKSSNPAAGGPAAGLPARG